MVSSDIPVWQLYFPVVCRGFAYAVLSATFMVCLEEIMTFQHFFQALSVFNMLHMVMGGVMGSALYTQGLSYYVADNMARYGAALDGVSAAVLPLPADCHMEAFLSSVMEISIKQLYGWTAYACVFLLLLYDAPVRRQLKLMPGWRSVRSEVVKSFFRKRR